MFGVVFRLLACGGLVVVCGLFGSVDGLLCVEFVGCYNIVLAWFDSDALLAFWFCLVSLACLWVLDTVGFVDGVLTRYVLCVGC